MGCRVAGAAPRSRGHDGRREALPSRRAASSAPSPRPTASALYDGRALEATSARNNGHPGSGALAGQLRRAPLLTRSELEAILLAAARAHGVADPMSDHPIHLPIAGWQHHRARASFEADSAHDLELAARGDRVARLTDRQLRGDRRRLFDQISALL